MCSVLCVTCVINTAHATLPERINFSPWSWHFMGWNILELRIVLTDGWFNNIWVHLFVFDRAGLLFVRFWRNSTPPPQWALASFTRFLHYTQRCTTLGSTPLEEWSPRRRDLYLLIHNTYNRQISISCMAAFLKLWSADHKWSSGSALVVLLDWTLVQKRQKK